MPYPQPGAALRQGRRSRNGLVAGIVAAVVLLGAMGTGAWLHTHHGTRSPGPGRAVGSVGPIPPASTSPVPGSPGPVSSSPSAPGTPEPASPSPSSLPPTSPSPGGIPVASGVTDSAAPRIAAFLDQYFTAINRHDYAAYIALESPQERGGLTPGQFQNGYGSTADSGETLQDISVDGNGDYVARVTFTSRQRPAQSVTGTACTQWDISLYLLPNGASFLIDKPPSSYHAIYASC